MDNLEFAKKLASKTALSEQDAAKFVTAFTDTLGDYFKKGEKVVMADFGSFFVTNDKTVQFSPSAKLKELVG